ncbi:MAG: DUF357 domain-containing protein [Sulfolobales archaeon]|nr:DUF357 domain-containing protein [Sulfolobales archaeon]
MVDDVARVRSYINSLELALKEARTKSRQSKEVADIVKLAELYMEDAKYYLSLGDLITSTSCVAYAEGLIDALRMLGLADFSWRRSEVYRVLVAGTFDLLHPGHVYFLNRAYELGLPYVVVSRDVNVIRSKGRPPVMSELDRLTMVSSLKPVYKAVLGDTEDYLKPVVEIHPDVILLGPDQFVDENQLTRELESRGLRSTRVLRVKERLDNYSSTQLIKRAREVLNNSIK